jgi:hypothetical protein
MALMVSSDLGTDTVAMMLGECLPSTGAVWKLDEIL